MFTKIKELFSSIRFWIVTFAAIAGILSLISQGADMSAILNAITVYFTTVAGIGTLDSIATKIGSSSK